MCRFERRIDCATFFARWAFDHPESAQLEATLAQLRKSARRGNPEIAAARIQQLRALYGEPELLERDAFTSEEALNLTRLFLGYYHCAVPFDRRVLEAAWDRCRGEDCATERLQAEQSLWGLGDH